jgi:hypothetical protein
VRTTTQQLDAVDAAIAAIESGAQSFTVLGRLWQKADIGKLYEERGRLKAELTRETRGGSRIRLARPTAQ